MDIQRFKNTFIIIIILLLAVNISDHQPEHTATIQYLAIWPEGLH